MNWCLLSYLFRQPMCLPSLRLGSNLEARKTKRFTKKDLASQMAHKITCLWNWGKEWRHKLSNIQMGPVSVWQKICTIPWYNKVWNQAWQLTDLTHMHTQTHTHVHRHTHEFRRLPAECSMGKGLPCANVWPSAFCRWVWGRCLTLGWPYQPFPVPKAT